MIAGPFFSNKDSELLRQGSVRDYLGLLPVWSKIARQLEPNLSGAISSYRGLEAVLFIYYLEKKYVAASDGQNNHFRQRFQYMEALIEYYFYHSLNINPCYGSRLLKGNPADVEIKITSATVVNGLYQFYRGTCRRAGMLSNDWVLDEDVVTIMDSLCAAHSDDINKLMKRIEIKILAKNQSVNPEEIFSNSKFIALFGSIFEAEALKKYIKKCLYVDSHLEYYARACASILALRKEQGNDATLNLAQHLSTYIAANNKQWSYFKELEQINHAEPFLSLLDDFFQLLHLYAGRKLSDIELIFADKNVKQALQSKAINFRKIISYDSDYDTKRFRSLIDMAGLLANEDVKSFLLALLNYHQGIMKTRGANAMITLEGNYLRAISEMQNLDQATLLDSILNTNPWKNGYYINTSAGIYSQLNGEK